ncbi:effector-associated constant component EACC1 [Streptomyces sp. NBC_01304]|uniref:effector-associated constant component EACC1 n=1 Tax=Streptomyces sp. NBC_01304 TaxID=2903818 RepID=UPI002E16189E|nr:hypothetical protein OG430_05510 [Streptomyces sp. NBC_01304]
MEIRFELLGSATDERDEDVESLHAWLAGDEGLRGQIRIEGVKKESPAGAMGSSIEVVLAVIGVSGALAQLPPLYAAWLTGRRRGRSARLTLNGLTPGQVERVLGALGPEATWQADLTGTQLTLTGLTAGQVTRVLAALPDPGQEHAGESGDA